MLRMEDLSMIKSLKDFQFQDFLPESLKRDSDSIALADALTLVFQLIYEKSLLVNLLDQIPDEFLDYIAYEENIDFYETTLPIETKRQLIQDSPFLHKTKGTPAAVEKALKSVLGDVSLTEWFEYGGNPFHFQVDINVLNTGVTQETLSLVEKIIEAYKNKRSIIEKINLYLTNRSKSYFTSIGYCGEETLIYPWRQTEIVTTAMYSFAIGSQLVDTTSIYPKVI